MKQTDHPPAPTAAQINANRENAKKSTGPRTAAGKEASSRNGLKHGLSGDKHILPGENPEEFLLLLKDLYDNLRPVGLGEEKLALRIAADQWRLDRIFPMEAAIYRQCLEAVAARDYTRKRELVNHKRNHERNPEIPPAPAPPDPGDRLTRAFIVDGDGRNSLTRLARYETSIERSIDRCLRQLKAFQAARNTPHPAGPEPPEAPETKPETAHQTAPVPPDKEDYEANPKDDGQTHNPAQQPAETADRTEARGAKPPAETPVPAQPSPALP